MTAVPVVPSTAATPAPVGVHRGPAGIALYTVITVNHTQGRTLVAVDGGMSDNPRRALYGARYTARLIARTTTAPPAVATIVGRHCEAGDVLADDVDLPSDVRPSDVLAVPASGAYQLSMASNYTMVTRPPVVALATGHARLIVRRETFDDLGARDVEV